MQIEQSKNLFAQYLHVELNSEPLEFLQKVQDYRKQITDIFSAQQQDKPQQEVIQQLREKCQKMGSEIVDTFIKDQSPKEVNLSHGVKQKFFNIWNQIQKQIVEQDSTSLVPSELPDVQINPIHGLQRAYFHAFDNVYSVTYCLLKLDVFPRFIRSKIFTKFIKKNSSIVKSLQKQTDDKQILYTMEDYYAPTITEKDVRFIQYLNKDSNNWKLFKYFKKSRLEDCATCYINSGEIMAGNNVPSYLKKRPFVKIDMYLPFGLDQVLRAVFDEEIYAKVDPNWIGVDRVSFTKPDKSLGIDYASSILTEKFRIPLFAPRILHYNVTLVRDPDDPNIIYEVIRDAKMTQKPPKGYVKGHIVGCFAFQRIDDELTRFSNVVAFHLGGTFGKIAYTPMAKLMASDRCTNYRKKIIEALQEQETIGHPMPQHSFSLFECLELNEAMKI